MNKADWDQLVREWQAQCQRGAEVAPEVAEELAHHLEDAYESFLRQGLKEEEAIRRARAEVKNWPRLARKINQARGGSEMLKQRIQTLWLPGLVPMIFALGLLCAGLRAGSAPRMVSVTPRVAVLFYGGWLLILPGIGALAAYWSRRAGGSIANRAAAALFPAAMMTVIFLVVLVHAVFANDHLALLLMPVSRLFYALLSSSIGGILLPAGALLAGAVPFLRNKPAKGTLDVGAA